VNGLPRTPATSTGCRRWPRGSSPASSTTTKEITAVTNQWVNSYKRLIPAYEAPVYICWAGTTALALRRVPSPAGARSAAGRNRAPDPACNPLPGLLPDVGRRV